MATKYLPWKQLRPPVTSVPIESTGTVTPAEALPEPTDTAEPEPQDEFSLDSLAEWDLVYISDNTGSGVPYYLPKYIEEDTGKTVILHDFVITELSAQAVLDELRGGTANEQFAEDLQGLKEAVAGAEVIVFFAGNYDDIEGMDGLTGDLMSCWEYATCNLPDNCTLDLYQPYTDVLSQFFQEMLALRAGKPTVIRALDFYNPYLSDQAKCGVEMKTSCAKCWTTFGDAIRRAAETYNIALVSIYDLFNGVNHDQDPKEKGYLGAYGFFPSTDGCKAIAQRIREEGYDPVSP
jgi:hypothetical protein